MHGHVIVLHLFKTYMLILSCLASLFLAWVFVRDERRVCIYFPIEHVKKLQVETWADRWALHTSVFFFSDERLFFHHPKWVYVLLHVFLNSQVSTIPQFFVFREVWHDKAGTGGSYTLWNGKYCVLPWCIMVHRLWQCITTLVYIWQTRHWGHCCQRVLLLSSNSKQLNSSFNSLFCKVLKMWCNTTKCKTNICNLTRTHGKFVFQMAV